ncbi:hypothetical protein, partial [Staphylococcus pseudintermedius]|uniref:hypothetical protein n=2 Tax=Staphylococcus pseudintermedius TaxID=283734 RepID=UPI001C60CAF8
WLTQDIEPPSTEPYARWCERTSSQLMAILLLDILITLFKEDNEAKEWVVRESRFSVSLQE